MNKSINCYFCDQCHMVHYGFKRLCECGDGCSNKKELCLVDFAKQSVILRSSK